AAALPVSFAHQPPCVPPHPQQVPADSVRLCLCWPHLRALLLHRIASRSVVLLPCFMFGPSPPVRQLLWPRLTSGNSSPRLSAQVALGQTARSPRVLRTHLPAYACRIYVAAFRARIGLRIYWPAYPAAPPLSASCSSGQRFAFSFLQISPRGGHPCCSANTSPCRVCRGLSPPSECALPGAPTRRPPVRAASLSPYAVVVITALAFLPPSWGPRRWS